MNRKEKLEKDLAELKAEKHLYSISEYVCVKQLLKAQYENECKDDCIQKLVQENLKLKNKLLNSKKGKEILCLEIKQL